MNTLHPSFPQPSDPTIPVWRYLSLPKFISLLSSSSIYFCRSDLLGDPYEGTIPVTNAADIRSQFCDPGRPELIVKARKMIKLFTYVSCWHLNPTESEAMWRLYCPTNDGIAIRSTYDCLAKSVQGDDTYIGLIRYIDYRSQFMPLDNMFNPLMHKRKAFEHEKEVRVVKQLPNNIQSVERDFDEMKCREENPLGVNVQIDIARAIDAVFVNPYAAKWYYDVVQSVLDKFSIPIHAEWSHISDEPLH